MQDIAKLVSLAQTIRESLEKAFGISFSIWTEQEGWQPLDVLSFTVAASVENLTISKILGQNAVGNAAETINICGTTQLLVLPVDGAKGLRVVVAGAICSHDLALARAFADSTLNAAKQALHKNDSQDRLNQSLIQITSDFEELTWLRSLSVHFKGCDIRSGIDEVCRSIMPALVQLISAKSIALYGKPDEQTNLEIENEPPELLFCCGDCTLQNKFSQSLLGQAIENKSEEPIVWNSQDYTTKSLIKNYILVPLQSGDRHYGWLVALNKDCPNVLESDCTSSNLDRNCFEFGTVEAGLMRTLAVMLATHGRNNELYRQKEELFVGVLCSLVNTIDAKDAYTYGHSDRVASMSKCIARELGYTESECEQVHMAGLLHDIGKIGVPDNVLGKPGKLTEDEYDAMKKHPKIGFDILKHLKPLEFALPGVLYHHEAMNGKGYPFGLVGEEIPMLGRIIAVADSYDAMTSDRIYRKGLETSIAEQILRNGSGNQWDSGVIDAFFNVRSDIYTICGFGRPLGEVACPPSNDMNLPIAPSAV
jgi:HD-GYP domain-containing protein (c-di-GMP phosphodiesterase class II)